MHLIKNYDDLSTSNSRKILLDLIESGLAAIQPETAFHKNVKLQDSTLSINNNYFDLQKYNNIYIVGFGKGSAKNAKFLEDMLGDRITAGCVIDTTEEDLKKIQFTKGTHPLPSVENLEFTENIMKNLSNLTENDLVIVIVCGGGSAMLVHPHSISLEQKIEIGKLLLKSGADIIEMNKVRQHLSDVKGGGLAQILYPAHIATLIFSDVPGNDMQFIASGPTVKSNATIDDAINIIKKYNLTEKINLPREAFINNPQDDKYFQNVTNSIVLSNVTLLEAIEEKAHSLGLEVTRYSDSIKGDAKEVAKELLENSKGKNIIVAAGETTVKVTGTGKGGRNQQTTLEALKIIDDNTLFASVASDGWDFTDAAGAIADKETRKKAKELNLNIDEHLSNNDSYTFFQKTSSQIHTDRLPSNVSDFMIVLKEEMGSNTKPEILELEKTANEIRQLIIKSLVKAGSGHSGGPLGMADIFTALYFKLLNIDPKNPNLEDRDRLVLSNGHICPVLYATLAKRGFFPVEELDTLRQLGSRLQGHPHRTTLPGIENTSGPLGEGLSQAIGMALVGKMDKKDFYVFCLTSDGEHQEGNTWEAAIMAPKYKLNNLIQIIDRNYIQIDGRTNNVMPLDPLKDKYESFGWHVVEIDGNNMNEIIEAVESAKKVEDKPIFILANTIPGKGVSFMENDYTWHGKPPNEDEAQKALEELQNTQHNIERRMNA